MSFIENLGRFPHTIGNLDDRPNMTGQQLKSKLEQDVMTLWAKLVEVVPYVNEIIPVSRLVDIVNHSSTNTGVPTAKAVYDAIADASLGGNAQQIIDDWLDDHPEATTTVTDGSITNAKLATSFVTPGVAAAYSSSNSYNVGDYAIYNGSLYRCIHYIDTPELWTAAHWKQETLSDILSFLKKEKNDNNFQFIKNADFEHVYIGPVFENTWVNANGNEEYASGWSSTDYIKLREGSSVLGIYTTVATSWVWFFDEDKYPVAARPAAVGFSYITIPDDSAFVRVSNTDAGIASLVLYDDNKTRDALDTGYLDKGRLLDNTWLDSNGDEDYYAGWSATAFIEIPEAYTQIVVSSPNPLTWNFFYDSDKAKIERFPNAGTQIHEVPATAKYVRLSGPTADIEGTNIYGDGAIVDMLLSANILNNAMYPKYYDSHILTKVRTINQKIAAHPGNDAFVFINDIHYPSNTMYSPKLIEDVCKKTGITTVQLNGDYINKENVKADAFVQINRICGVYQYPGVDTYISVGNHEYNNPPASDTPEALALQLSQDELRWPILHKNRKKVTIDPFSLSYYYDNEDAKIRYIVGTVGRGSAETDESQAFVARELQNVPSGYGVVIIFHSILTVVSSTPTLTTSGQVLANILDAAKSKTTITVNGVTYNYTGKNFDIICALCGDYHLDMDYTTSGGVKIVATTCDAYAQQWSIGGVSAPRDTGTYEEQAFDVVTIDRTAKKVYMTRIGYGSDREYSYA